MTHITNSS